LNKQEWVQVYVFEGSYLVFEMLVFERRDLAYQSLEDVLEHGLDRVAVEQADAFGDVQLDEELGHVASRASTARRLGRRGASKFS
jgi:hypothetical protein